MAQPLAEMWNSFCRFAYDQAQVFAMRTLFDAAPYIVSRFAPLIEGHVLGWILLANCLRSWFSINCLGDGDGHR